MNKPEDLFQTIGEQYSRIRTEDTPVRKWIEDPMMEALCADLTGMDVADLACSDGHFTAKLHRFGAKSVVGIDISETMIAVAKARHHGLDIRFEAADIFDVRYDRGFDFIFSSFVTSYASDRNDLKQMASKIASLLKPGGRLVGFCEPDHLPSEHAVDTRRYGKTKHWPSTPKEETKIDIAWHHDGQTIPFQCTYFHPQTIVWAFEASGLVDVERHIPVAGHAAKRAFEPDYWSDLDKAPLFNMFTASKAR